MFDCYGWSVSQSGIDPDNEKNILEGGADECQFNWHQNVWFTHEKLLCRTFQKIDRNSKLDKMLW